MSLFGRREQETVHQALVIENNMVTLHKIYQDSQGMLETDRAMLPLDEATPFYNTDGGMLYVYNLDLPARVEAEKLKSLRRSVVIGKLFNYDKEKGFSLMSWMPWIIVVLLILFHK